MAQCAKGHSVVIVWSIACAVGSWVGPLIRRFAGITDREATACCASIVTSRASFVLAVVEISSHAGALTPAQRPKCGGIAR